MVEKGKKKKDNRKKKDFIYNLCSYVLNTQCKIINIFSGNSAGQTYTIMRWGIHLARVKDKYDSRKKKHFYDWMIIKKENVSKYNKTYILFYILLE